MVLCNQIGESRFLLNKSDIIEHVCKIVVVIGLSAFSQ